MQIATLRQTIPQCTCHAIIQTSFHSYTLCEFSHSTRYVKFNLRHDFVCEYQQAPNAFLSMANQAAASTSAYKRQNNKHASHASKIPWGSKNRGQKQRTWRTGVCDSRRICATGCPFLKQPWIAARKNLNVDERSPRMNEVKRQYWLSFNRTLHYESPITEACSVHLWR